jgi:hypothetical protein
MRGQGVSFGNSLFLGLIIEIVLQKDQNTKKAQRKIRSRDFFFEKRKLYYSEIWLHSRAIICSTHKGAANCQTAEWRVRFASCASS